MLTCYGPEEPKTNCWFLIRVEDDLLREAPKILQRLGGHVIEVHQVSDRVQDTEEQGRGGYDLVELQTEIVTISKLKPQQRIYLPPLHFFLVQKQ